MIGSPGPRPAIETLVPYKIFLSDNVTTKVVNHTKWNETTSLPPSCPIQRKKMSESDIYFLNNNIALFIIICCNNRPWSPRLKQWLFNIKRCHAQGHVANTIKIITYLEIVTQRHRKKYIKIYKQLGKKYN
jgi:hypothetical protein